MEAIAAAVAELCERSDSGLVLDDPRNIAAAAALAAVRVLGRDRCIHVKAVHAEHHARTGPVDGCPWCLADRAASHPEPVVRPPGIKMAVTLTSAPPVQEIAAALHRLRQQPPGGRA
jgi:DNA-binding helix-hairpin-helix protein with protein kinase domain